MRVIVQPLLQVITHELFICQLFICRLHPQSPSQPLPESLSVHPLTFGFALLTADNSGIQLAEWSRRLLPSRLPTPSPGGCGPLLRGTHPFRLLANPRLLIFWTGPFPGGLSSAPFSSALTPSSPRRGEHDGVKDHQARDSEAEDEDGWMDGLLAAR